MTKAEAIARVEAYLHHACAVLRAHEALKKCPLYEKASRSATNKALKQLLGDELTHLMWVADEEGFRLKRYMMAADKRGKRTDDHVVPLGVIVDRLASWPQLYETTAALKTFLARCLVTAYIPDHIEKSSLRGPLRNSMPEEGAAWHTGDPDAIWSRYSRISRPPGSPGSKLQPLPADVGRKCKKLRDVQSSPTPLRSVQRLSTARTLTLP